MKYRTSEIFEDYAKLALDRGLIDNTLPIKTAEDTSPRYDTLSFDEIKALYGVKIPGESEKSILEQAHPNSVIISPAYDKVNGLVENLQERHNIMVGIAKKPVNGLLTQHSYAATQQNLLNELIKVAFLLDRENEIDLMVLADSCSERLTKIANPLAMLVPILIGAGAVLTYVSISQNLHLSQGVVQDCSKALTELQEAIESNSEHPELETELSDLIEKIKAVKGAGEQVAAIQLHPVTDSQAQTAASAYISLKEGKDVEAIKLMNGFAEGCQDLGKSIPEYVALLKLKGQQYENSHPDFLEPLRRTYRFFIPSDIEDACGALEALQKSCLDSPSQIQSMIKLFHELREKTQQSVEQLKNKLKGEDLKEDDKPDTDTTNKPASDKK